MPICFESCAGAPADVAEMEYIAALFMTCRDMNAQQQQQPPPSASRNNNQSATATTRPRQFHSLRRRQQQEGTIHAGDVCHYLMSRHGLSFSLGHVEEQILVHLAGTRRRCRRCRRSTGDRRDSLPGSQQRDEEECPSEEEENVQENGSNLRGQNDVNNGGNDQQEDEFGTKMWRGNFLSKKRSAKEEEKVDGDENANEDDEDEDRLSMDMVQLMALLFIPELIRIRQDHEIGNNSNDNQNEDESNDSSDALRIVVKAALLSMLELAGVEYGAELTMEILQQIMRAHGEEHLFEEGDDHEVRNDGIALLKEMLACCCANKDPSSNDGDAATCNFTSSITTLTEESILRALTNDVADCYHLHREDRISTHFQDALYDPRPDHQLGRQYDTQGKRPAGDGERLRSGVLGGGGRMSSGGQHGDGKGNDESTVENTVLQPIYTASSCDNTADTFQSYWWNILSWATLVITFFAYLVRGFASVDSTLPNVDCAEPTENAPFEVYACKTLQVIALWLQLLFRLALLGTVFLFFSTWGNSIWHAPTPESSTTLDGQARNRHWWRIMFRYSRAIFTHVVGILVVVCATILSYSFEVRTRLFTTEKSKGDAKLSQYIGSLILGCILLVVQLGELIRLLSISFRHKLTSLSSTTGKATKTPTTPSNTFAQKLYSAFLRFGRIFASSSTRMERALKCAARFKTQRMLQNALSCHIPTSPADLLPDVLEHKTQQLDTTTLQERNDLVVRKISSSPAPELQLSAIDYESPADAADATSSNNEKGELSIVEIEPNKKAVSCSHVLLNYQYSQRYDFQELGGIIWTWKRLLWTQRTFLQEDGIWIPSRIAASQVGQWFVCFLIPGLFIYVVEKNFLSIKNHWDVMFGCTVGAFFSFIAALSTAISFVPSAVSQILQFRTGVIGSLKDKNFQVYRVAPDDTTLLFGSSFWGIIFTAGVVWFCVGALAYVLVLEDIREFALWFIAYFTGILVTVALKIIILRCLRSSLYGGFYRRRPVSANLLYLALECWSLGLSPAFLFMRTLKLMLITIFYLARIDTPLLAPGVGSLFSTIHLDASPIAFRKSLLIHEAHRHPYIERLGLLFMLKLRHGPRFGSRAGAAWRILFVLSLAPWMRSHRQGTNGIPTALRDTRSIHSRKEGQEEPSMDQVLHENQMLELENEMLRKRTEELTRMLQDSMLGSINHHATSSNIRVGRRFSVPNARRLSSTTIRARTSERSSSSDRNKWISKYISC